MWIFLSVKHIFSITINYTFFLFAILLPDPLLLDRFKNLKIYLVGKYDRCANILFVSSKKCARYKFFHMRTLTTSVKSTALPNDPEDFCRLVSRPFRVLWERYGNVKSQIFYLIREFSLSRAYMFTDLLKRYSH